VADFEPEFRDALSEYDIVVRNDDASVGKMKLQDLLEDNLAQLLLGVLYSGDEVGVVERQR
jgi:hypothetical protein